MNIIEATKLMKEQGLICYRSTAPGISVKCLDTYKVTYNDAYQNIKEDYQILVHANTNKCFYTEIDDILANDWEIFE